MNKEMIKKIVNRIDIPNPAICYGIIGSSCSIFKNRDIGALIEPEIGNSILLNIIDNMITIKSKNYSHLCDCNINKLHKFLQNEIKDSLSDIDKNSVFFIIIENFHRLNSKEQCDFISSFRSWNQSDEILTKKNIKTSLLLCGQWSYQKLKKQWNTECVSPAPDLKNVIVLAKQSLADIILYLINRYGNIKTEELLNYSRYIYDLTHGDCQLIEILLSNINTGRDLTLNNLETASFNLSERLLDSIRKRIDYLNSAQIKILEKLCLYQVLHIKKNDKNIDLLEILGLIKKTETDLTREILIEYSSDIIGNILRKNNIFKKSQLNLKNEELINISCASNEIAYKIILRIENFLRNCVVLKLCKNNISLSQTMKNLGEKKKYIRKGEKKSQIIEWEEYFKIGTKQNDNLLDAPSITCLTVKELCEEFINKKFFKSFFKNNNNNNDFTEKMAIFGAIRNDIAHNRIISISAIKKLKETELWLLEKIGRFAVEQDM